MRLCPRILGSPGLRLEPLVSASVSSTRSFGHATATLASSNVTPAVASPVVAGAAGRWARGGGSCRRRLRTKRRGQGNYQEPDPPLGAHRSTLELTAMLGVADYPGMVVPIAVVVAIPVALASLDHARRRCERD
jgi:hypothetical protein